MGLAIYAIDPDSDSPIAEPVVDNRSYRSFNNFRDRLAFTEGRRHFWDNAPATVLDPLLHHSDCEGLIFDDECRQMAPRLLTIGAAWLRHDPTDPDGLYAIELGWAMLVAGNRRHFLEFA